jgi:hypothetical protein
VVDDVPVGVVVVPLVLLIVPVVSVVDIVPLVSVVDIVPVVSVVDIVIVVSVVALTPVSVAAVSVFALSSFLQPVTSRATAKSAIRVIERDFFITFS